MQLVSALESQGEAAGGLPNALARRKDVILIHVVQFLDHCRHLISHAACMIGEAEEMKHNDYFDRKKDNVCEPSLCSRETVRGCFVDQNDYSKAVNQHEQPNQAHPQPCLRLQRRRRRQSARLTANQLFQ